MYSIKMQNTNTIPENKTTDASKLLFEISYSLPFFGWSLLFLEDNTTLQYEQANSDEGARVITINEWCALRCCPDHNFCLSDGIHDRWIDVHAKLIKCSMQYVARRDKRKRGYRLVACFRQRERSRRLNDMSRLDRT
jgi:hypothetical protein